MVDISARAEQISADQYPSNGLRVEFSKYWPVKMLDLLPSRVSIGVFCFEDDQELRELEEEVWGTETTPIFIPELEPKVVFSGRERLRQRPFIPQALRLCPPRPALRPGTGGELGRSKALHRPTGRKRSLILERVFQHG